MPYAFDATGVLPENKILNEVHNVLVGSPSFPYLIVPINAPFYKDRFALVSPSGETLIEGVHYYFTHYWPEGYDATGKELYGSISLTSLTGPSPTGMGDYKVNYQTIGEDPILGSYNHAGILADGITAMVLSQLLVTNWENAPEQFPSTVHKHPLMSGMEGMAQLYEKFDQIVDALTKTDPVIQVDDVEDLGAEFIEPVKDSLNEIILQITKPTLDGNEISDINTKLNYLLPYASLTGMTDLAYYDIPIARFFKIKVGKFTYDPIIQQGNIGGLPLEIAFPLAFPNQCMYASVVVGIDGSNQENHIVRWGKPTKSKIPQIHVEMPDNLFPTNIRYLTYFAFGL